MVVEMDKRYRSSIEPAEELQETEYRQVWLDEMVDAEQGFKWSLASNISSLLDKCEKALWLFNEYGYYLFTCGLRHNVRFEV